MNLIKQSYSFLSPLDEKALMLSIERSARLCYKSEDKITEGSANRIVSSLIQRGHHAMLEHAMLPTVRFVTDRGVTHELVRHRLCAFAQESTRYCNYKGGVTFIKPSWFNTGFCSDNPNNFDHIWTYQEEMWHDAMDAAATTYMAMLDDGASPQEARTVLPNSLKTEIDVTCNVREWRHILTLRTAKSAHPQMRDLMSPLLRELQSTVPYLFNDIGDDR